MCVFAAPNFLSGSRFRIESVSELDQQIETALRDIADAPSLEALDAKRVAFLGKTGLVTEQLKQLVNRAKERLQAAIAARKESLENAAFDARLASERIDVTLPGRDADLGGVH